MRFNFFTYNVDFNRSNQAETTSLRSIRDQADVACVQEAKHLRVKGALGDFFRVHQNLRRESKQGVAIAWRQRKVKAKMSPATRRKFGRPLGGYVLGVSNFGLKMLPRYINYRLLDFNGTTVLVISTHRPPKRFSRLWSLFDRALIRFIKSVPFPVIVGMDSNTRTHALFARLSGMTWRGIGIDGFWISRSLVDNIVKGSLKAHPKSKSDHHPVSLAFDF